MKRPPPKSLGDRVLPWYKGPFLRRKEFSLRRRRPECHFKSVRRTPDVSERAWGATYNDGWVSKNKRHAGRPEARKAFFGTYPGAFSQAVDREYRHRYDPKHARPECNTLTTPDPDVTFQLQIDYQMNGARTQTFNLNTNNMGSVEEKIIRTSANSAGVNNPTTTLGQDFKITDQAGEQRNAVLTPYTDANDPLCVSDPALLAWLASNDYVHNAFYGSSQFGGPVVNKTHRQLKSGTILDASKKYQLLVKIQLPEFMIDSQGRFIFKP